MDQKGAPSDARAAAIAARQHGVISIAQLRAAGFSDTAVRRRVQHGRLHRVHRGVYAVGHRGLTDAGRWMAAGLALGRTAALSPQSAAALWGLLERSGGIAHVSISSRAGRQRRAGILVHRCRSLSREQVTMRRGIPVTTVARTIADLRRTIPPPELRRAVRNAEVLGYATGLPTPHDGTRSELEQRFLRLCRRHRLPSPEVNARVGPFTVDFLWGRQRLVVETDGYRYHRGQVSFEDDHSRDLELRLLGYEVLRLSHRQVVEEGERVVAALRDDLTARRSWR